jgi:hypothetical protein
MHRRFIYYYGGINDDRLLLLTIIIIYIIWAVIMNFMADIDCFIETMLIFYDALSAVEGVNDP